jgi:hypothetical protein
VPIFLAKAGAFRRMKAQSRSFGTSVFSAAQYQVAAFGIAHPKGRE